MLNTNNCIQDEKYSPKHVYIGFFCVCKFWRREKKDGNTAIAALINALALHFLHSNKLTSCQNSKWISVYHCKFSHEQKVMNFYQNTVVYSTKYDKKNCDE